MAILGFDARGPDADGVERSQISGIHRDLCHFLEGRAPHRPWRRGLVCTFRGGAKSTWTSQAYPMWRGLYIINFSTKLIENSADNAKRNHFLPIVELFTTSPRADYLQWLFEHRIPPGFDGWTREQIKLNQTDPLANPAMSYWGVESKFEGSHPDLAVGDDLEGADAEKSLGANDEAWFAYQSLIPLLKHPTRSQILLVGTPHGRNPLVYRIRDRERRPADGAVWASERDNEWSDFKIFWRSVTDASGASAWPERFTADYIESLRREDIFPQQYLLQRTASTHSLFRMDVVLGGADADGGAGSCYERSKADRHLLRYPGFDYDPAKSPSDPTYRLSTPVPCEVRLPSMRYYLHHDPLHKALEERRGGHRRRRPAEAAIVVVGVTDKLHALVVDTWHGDADIDEQLFRLFSLYCKWCPAVVTYEGVGAQAWIPSLVRSYEAQSDRWRKPMSTEWLGVSMELPRMSLRMVEDPKSNEAKEWVYREGLSSWVNRGLLHFNRDQDELLAQLENVLDDTKMCDLVDALSQGVKLWAPPRADDANARKFAAYRAVVDRKLAAAAHTAGGWMQRAGYTPPWSRRT